MVAEIKTKTDADEEWQAKKLWVKYYKDVKKQLRDNLKK